MWILYWMQRSAPLCSTVWLSGLIRYFLIQKGPSSRSWAIASHSVFRTWSLSPSLAHLHSAKMIRRFDGFGDGLEAGGLGQGSGAGSPARGGLVGVA